MVFTENCFFSGHRHQRRITKGESEVRHLSSNEISPLCVSRTPSHFGQISSPTQICRRSTTLEASFVNHQFITSSRAGLYPSFDVVHQKDSDVPGYHESFSLGNHRHSWSGGRYGASKSSVVESVSLAGML